MMLKKALNLGVLLLGCLSVALAQQPINPATQIRWPAGCQVYNVATATCPPIGVITFRGTWSSGTTYNLNDAVYYAPNGSTYVSLQASNLNQNPSTATTFWSLFASGIVAQVDGVNLLTNSPVNYQSTPTIKFSNPSAGNVTATALSNFQTSINLPSTAQHVIVYPSTVANITGDPGTGSVTSIPGSSYIQNGPGGGSLSTNTWGTTFTNWNLPSNVLAVNVTGVYLFQVSQLANISNTFWSTQCVTGVGNFQLNPFGSPSYSGTGWSLQQTTTSVGTSWSALGSISCTDTSNRSVTTGGSTATFAANSIGAIVYYNGTPPAASASTGIVEPLSFNPAANTLGIDTTTFGLNQLTGDVAAGPGTGSQAATLATVNSNVGSCGDSSHVPQLTLNAKGLATACSPVVISSVNAINQLTGDVAAGPGTGSQAATLATVNANVGSCGDATHVSQVTLNAKGLATGCTPVSITAVNAINQLTGDVTAGPGTGSQATTLATVNANVGSCGDATHVSQVTLNAKGLATACTPVAITATTVTIASGTAALGTSSIASGGPCATVVTVTATGVLAATDVVGWGFNGDPTSTVGYQASTNGMLTIIAYPGAGNVNFKVCNNTLAAVTPGAITLNWRVVR